jgi:pyruvate-formate lyase
MLHLLLNLLVRVGNAVFVHGFETAKHQAVVRRFIAADGIERLYAVYASLTYYYNINLPAEHAAILRDVQTMLDGVSTLADTVRNAARMDEVHVAVEALISISMDETNSVWVW